MNFKHISFVLIGLTISLNACSQQEKLGGWLSYLGNQTFKTKWNIHNEFQYRKPNLSETNNMFFIRTGVGLNLSENNNNLLLGYGYFQTTTEINESESNVIREHRIFQQYILKNDFNKFHLQHRIRLEERFFSNDFKLRFRYFLGVTIPLNKTELSQNTIYISLYDELFLNTSNNAFDQNRAYGGLGYFIGENLKGELGLLNLHTTNQNQYIIQFSLFNNIPF